MLRLSFLWALLFPVSLLSAQVITLLNPGFEDDMPKHSKTPQGWTNCGHPNESPPDILPEATFQVTKPAYEGNTYLGLVTRDNETWEAVGAKLSGTLERGKCYSFSIALARSMSYYSVSRSKNIPANYIAPTRLRIWGGRGPCEREELLATSSIIGREGWKTYTFILAPEVGSYSELTLEVFYGEDFLLFPTNGNLLLDDASVIRILPDCGKEEYGITDGKQSKEEVAVTKNKTPFPEEEGSPISLMLPSPRYFSGAEPLRSFLSNIMVDIEHNAEGLLIERSYQLDKEQEELKGYPAIHAMAYALNAYPGEEWELVVFDRDENRQQQRVSSLTSALNDFLYSYIFDCQVVGYNAAVDDGKGWFCMSVANGLYLRKL